MEVVSTYVFRLASEHMDILCLTDITCILFSWTHQNSIIMKLKTGNSSRCNKSVQCIEVRAVFREARPPARPPALWVTKHLLPSYCGVTGRRALNNQSVNGVYGSLNTPHPLCLCQERDEPATPVDVACLFRTQCPRSGWSKSVMAISKLQKYFRDSFEGLWVQMLSICVLKSTVIITVIKYSKLCEMVTSHVSVPSCRHCWLFGKACCSWEHVGVGLVGLDKTSRKHRAVPMQVPSPRGLHSEWDWRGTWKTKPFWKIFMNMLRGRPLVDSLGCSVIHQSCLDFLAVWGDPFISVGSSHNSNFLLLFLGDRSTDYANFYQGLWDCTGALSDELSFKRGDVIYILSKVRRYPQNDSQQGKCIVHFSCVWIYNTREKCQSEFF